MPVLRSLRAVFVLVGLVVVAVAMACGGGSHENSGAPGAPVDASTVTEDAAPALGTSPLDSIAIDPPSASITSVDGALASQSFAVVARYADGTSRTLSSGVSFSADAPQIGSVSSNGTYTARGSTGGLVHLKATIGSAIGTATITVKLLLHAGAAGAGAGGPLAGATTRDPDVTLAYPYDGTVFPRGLNAPLLMWSGGSPSDQVYVHLTSPTFELQAYAPAPGPAASYVFEPGIWQRLVDSISGPVGVMVARWDGTSAKVIGQQTWSVAPASMRGTIYYWAQNLGRVVRIKPGASAPDDFANAPPLTDETVYPASTCLMTCHTVSADGTTLVSGGGSFGGSYSLLSKTPIHSLGGVWGGGPSDTEDDPSVIAWSNAALTPDGKYLVENQMASQLSVASGGMGLGGMYATLDGSGVPGSGLPAEPVFMPAFSPDGSKLVFVGGSATLPPSWLASADPGPLKVMAFNESSSPMLSGETILIPNGNDPNYGNITWPTVSPDGRWVLYARSNGNLLDSRGTCTATSCDYSVRADLYLADATTPNREIRLAALDGDNYPFVAGARDLHYNYEPTFAPVAAGGYFWVVFTSRRTYGNALTGSVAVTKQLWVAAIDQAPTPGKDPSHPPFRLPGQDQTTLNLRGFWALDPCKGAGQACASGTECCGGYCSSAGDGGAVCTEVAPPCAAEGDKCSQTPECCGASLGTTCINSVCSEAPPR